MVLTSGDLRRKKGSWPEGAAMCDSDLGKLDIFANSSPNENSEIRTATSETITPLEISSDRNATFRSAACHRVFTPENIAPDPRDDKNGVARAAKTIDSVVQPVDSVTECVDSAVKQVNSIAKSVRSVAEQVRFLMEWVDSALQQADFAMLPIDSVTELIDLITERLY
jgi:hypothetical protein